MNTPTRFSLIQDDDCRWYLVPAEKREEARKYFDAVAAFWNDDDAEGDEPAMPKYIQHIDGPHRLTFENPSEQL